MRRRSTLPGRYQPSTIDVLRLNFCVRNGNRWNPQAIATAKGEQVFVGRVLWCGLCGSRRARAPTHTLTTVQEGRIISALVLDIDKFQAFDRLVSSSSIRYRTSTDDLSPCSLQGVSHACAPGIFFLRWVSRLDAFSVYPFRTSLPCYAVGTTTVAPEVRPFRSSRTRNSSSHDSYAHDG